MAVIVKYIVVRNGVEKMTFATKKEADAHDKMLDIADDLYEFLESENIGLDEKQIEKVSLLFAENRERIIPVLRGIKPKKVKISKTGREKLQSKETKPESKESRAAANASTEVGKSTSTSIKGKKSEAGRNKK